MALTDFRNNNTGVPGQSLGIDFFIGGGEHQGAACSLKPLLIFNQCAGIGVQVFRSAELHRVHEDAGHDDVGCFTGLSDQ